jgi:acyl carrier protein
MISRDEIFSQVRRLLVDHFELEEASVTLNARLYEDLDIDSIDAVDLIVELKSYTGHKINAKDFKTIRTIDDVVSVVFNVMKE